MSATSPRSAVATVLARFPGDAETIRRLVTASSEFDELCEHLALARRTLAAFEQRPDAPSRPEIAEYRSLVSDLETDIAQLIAEARDRDRAG
jgi:hypothetical protein